MSRIKDLRMQLSEEDIKALLAPYGGFVEMETETALIFPTICHNLEGGSPKLYYYTEDKIFKCYTGCNEMFDIFELMIKVNKLRGKKISLPEAINLTGVEQDVQRDQEIAKDLEYLKRLTKTKETEEVKSAVRVLDKHLLTHFTYDEIGLKSWIDEGINAASLDRFNIKYDEKRNAIVIPNLDHEGNLIGIRGRFLSPKAPAKYMPLKMNNEILSHPTGKFLYGYYENKHTISEKGLAIIFEGEKSVLKMETFYPQKNLALATLGKKITLDQLDALLKLNLNEVVLAYDKDYRNPKERKEKLEEYEKTVKILQPYFSVSLIVDYGNALEYKDSPIDQGKEVFEELIRNRVKR